MHLQAGQGRDVDAELFLGSNLGGLRRLDGGDALRQGRLRLCQLFRSALRCLPPAGLALAAAGGRLSDDSSGSCFPASKSERDAV